METIDLGGPVRFGKYDEYPEIVQQALATLVQKTARDLPYYAKSRAAFAKYISRHHAFWEGIKKCRQPDGEGYAGMFHDQVENFTEESYIGDLKKAEKYPFLHPEKARDFMALAAHIKEEYAQNPAALKGFVSYNYDTWELENMAEQIVKAHDAALALDIEAYAPGFTAADRGAIERYLNAHCTDSQRLPSVF